MAGNGVRRRLDNADHLADPLLGEEGLRMHLAGIFVATSDVAPVREWLHARPARASGSRPNCHLKKCQLNRVKIPPLRAPLSRKPLGALASGRRILPA